MLLDFIDFDLKSLTGVLVCGYLAAGIIVCIYKASSRDKQAFDSFNIVIRTRFLYAFGFFLIFMREAVPGFVSVNIAYTLLYTCIYFETGLILGLSNVYSQKNRTIAQAFLVISVLSFNIFEFYSGDPLLRNSLSSVIIISLCLLPFCLLFFSKHADAFTKGISIFYFVILCAFIPRIIVPFLDGSVSAQVGRSSQCLVFIVLILMMTVNTVIYLLFIKRRTDSDIRNFNTVISTVDLAVITVDNNCVITDFNLGAEKLLGYRRHEVIGQTPRFYTPEEHQATLDDMFEHLKKGDLFYNEVVRRHKDGRLMHCSSSHFPIVQENGTISGSVAVLRDITEKKMMVRALEETAKKAEEASRAKSMFLANMSHEIRTPLNGVIGFAELALDDEGIPHNTKEYLKKIKSSADSLIDIINDILDISKIESDKMKLERVPFDLCDILQTCKTIIEPKAQEKGVMLFFYSEPLACQKLVGDPTKLRQVLLNLLSNAVKFTNRGMVKLKAVPEEEANGGGATINFEVKDSGIGMNDEQIKNIFEPFIRGDATTTREQGGTGLGLAIAKNFVDMMGGSLFVESSPGLGTRFHFTLPFDTASEALECSAPNDKPPVLDKPAFSGEVLVCEDNRINQDVITSHLLRVGLNPTVAENGKEGLEYARERLEKGNPYDLILMDMYMPVMDGLDAVRNLVKIGNKAPVIALTANVLITDREMYLRQGLADCLGKPFTAQELWACLLRHLTPLKLEARPQEAWKAGDHPAEKTLIDNEVLNEELGLKRTSDDPQLYRRITKRFVQDYAGVIDSLNEMLDSGDVKSAHRKAHSLKSAARTIGAEKLANIAQEMEAALSKENTNLLAEQLPAFESALKELLGILAPPAGGEPEPEKNKGSLDVDEAAALVKVLSPLLEAGDTASLNYIDEIRTTLSPLSEAGEILAAQVEDYDFEAAYETLLDIIKTLLKYAPPAETVEEDRLTV